VVTGDPKCGAAVAAAFVEFSGGLAGSITCKAWRSFSTDPPGSQCSLSVLGWVRHIGSSS